MLIYRLIAGSLLLTVACGDLSTQTQAELLTPPSGPSPATPGGLRANDAALAASLYRSLGRRPGNMLFSPHAVSTALAMLQLGGAGETSRQISQAAGWGDNYRAAQQALSAGSTGVRHIDALWVSPYVQVHPDFPFLLGVAVGASLQRVDFRYPEYARSVINAWATEQSGGSIREVVAQGEVQASTRLLITTAVTMAVAWETAFSAPAPAPAPAPFFAMDGTLPEIQTVQQVSVLPFASNDLVSAVELPCQGEDVSLMVLLPRTSLQALEGSLNGLTLTGLRQSMQRTSVRLSIPVFSMTSVVSLRQALQSLGVTDVFDPTRARLPGLDMSQETSLDDIQQTAQLRLASPGAVATADAGLEGALMAAPGGMSTMQVNRPFIFALLDKRAGSLLFMGRVERP